MKDILTNCDIKILADVVYVSITSFQKAAKELKAIFSCYRSKKKKKKSNSYLPIAMTFKSEQVTETGNNNTEKNGGHYYAESESSHLSILQEIDNSKLFPS